jgi:hypothetical protein
VLVRNLQVQNGPHLFDTQICEQSFHATFRLEIKVGSQCLIELHEGKVLKMQCAAFVLVNIVQELIAVDLVCVEGYLFTVEKFLVFG